MKRSLLVCAVAVSLCSLGRAQETPHYELFVGGSYLRIHASGAELTQLLNLSPIQYQPHNMNLNLYGWQGTLTENVNHWLGGEFDAGGFYGTPQASFLYPASQLVSPRPNFSQAVPVTTRVQSYLFGPRLTLRRSGVVFFVHLPVGVAHVNTSLGAAAVVATNFQSLAVGTIKSNTALAVSPGGGVDVRLSRALMIRFIEVDYLLTHAYAQRQDNARVSAGLTFTFGEK